MSSHFTPQKLLCNITSCFFARRWRLEEKHDDFSRKTIEASDGSIVFDFTGGGGGVRRPKRSDGKSERGRSSRSNRGNGEPHIAEEDYLVFCFGEDGAIDIIGEDESITTADAVALQKGDEKSSKDDDGMKKERENLEVETQKNLENFEAGDSDCDCDCDCDCDSSLSDTSSGSFAFPILKMEDWIGSPVHMPKQENQSAQLHCWRF